MPSTRRNLNSGTDHPPLAESELIFTPEGRVYHLDVTGDDIADIVILVGDPGRVHHFARYLQKIEVQRQHREFHTCTGWYHDRRITILATGIGTDNIDIVLNELEIAINYDRQQQGFRKGAERRTLTVIRAGTCGSLQDFIQGGDLVVSTYACGLDPLAIYYRWNEPPFSQAFRQAFQHAFPEIPYVYLVKGNDALIAHFAKQEPGFPAVHQGITVSAPGFYGPQGREAGIPIQFPDLPERLHRFHWENHYLANFEMECSALYLLGSLLNYRCVTVCVALAGRLAGTFVRDYTATIDTLVRFVLQKVRTLPMP